MSVLGQLARAPLLHFVVLGALIFAAYHWIDAGQTARNGEHRIVIDQAEIDHLKNLWKLQWKHDPAPSDVAAIVHRYVRQEVFYREALRMKLDHNDGIIRRRLAQKMEAVANDLGTLMRPPTDEQLKEYLRNHVDFFRLPKAYAFRQIMFLPDERDGVEPTLASMRQGGAIPKDRLNKLSVPAQWSLTPVDKLGNAFGGEFAASLDKLPVGEWSGPVRSGYGWHLVFVERKEEPRVPDFGEIREYVAREYEYRTALKTQDKVFRKLLEKYEIDITAGDVPASIKAEFAR